MRTDNELSHLGRRPNPNDELTARSYRTLREAGIGNSGKFLMGVETVPVPSQASINVAPDRVAN
jgi:hypothetical protein